MKISLFLKENKPSIEKVEEYCRKNSGSLTVYKGKSGSAFPEAAQKDNPDILISYLSPWIIPEEILKRTRQWNINFHPGPPEYPGIGCFNFAIYNNDNSYGVTAHIMQEKVDTGKIIAVRRFPLLKNDSVYDLSLRSYGHLYKLFLDVMTQIVSQGSLPDAGENWRRKPYTRRELEDLCRITPQMSVPEIAGRIRATVYPDMPGPYIEFEKYRFEYNPDR